MPAKGSSPSVSYDKLVKLQQAGCASPFLQARLDYQETAILLNSHINPLVGKRRIYPQMVIPQASGRVGISDPPVGNFTADPEYGPHGLRNVIRPDKGTLWICADWSSVEGWIVSHRCQDPVDLEAKRKGLDLHTVTAIRMFRYPDPSGEPTKEWLKSSEGLAWREQVGFTEAIRGGVKNTRYCVPLDSLALTRRGWKKHDELIAGEDILTYNAEKGTKEWAPVVEIAVFPSAPVWEIGHSWLKVRCTPDHRWFVRQRYKIGKNWANDPYLRDEIRTAQELTSHSNIVMNAPMTPDLESRRIDDSLVLSKYGTNWTAHVVSMSSAERRAFLAGFLIADGYAKPKGGWIFSQLRGPLLDAALTAAFIEHDGVLRVSGDREGVKPGLPMATVSLSRKSHMTGQRMTKTVLPNQSVWCPVTHNGSWVMRQGDVITMTGNTMQYAKQPATVARYAVKLGLPPKTLIEFGHHYLRSKPWLVAWKNKIWADCWRTKEARTALGRRRRLLGDRYAVEKEGLNHSVQGSVADFMKITQISLAEIGCCMALQRHDGWYSTVSLDWDRMTEYKRIVERDWMIDGRPINFEAEYEVIDGQE